MKEPEYYELYEDIYVQAHRAGARTWGVGTAFEPLEEFLQSNDAPKPPCKVIDFGCGEGIYSLYLAKRGFDVVGVDISPSAIARAREIAAQEGVVVEFRVANVLSLDEFPDEGFSLGLNVACLHMLVTDEHRRQHMAEMRRVLQRGGMLFAFNNVAKRDVVIEDSEQHILQCMSRVELAEISAVGGKQQLSFRRLAFRGASLSQYRREFEAAGFQVLGAQLRKGQGRRWPMARPWDLFRPSLRAQQRFAILYCRKPLDAESG